MNRIVLNSSISIGLVFMLIYLVFCLRKKTRFTCDSVVRLILLGGSLVIGGFLVAGVMIPALRNYVGDVEFYKAVAGVAIVVISAKGVYEIFKSS